MFTVNKFRFYDFKFHLDPEAQDIALGIEYSVEIKVPSSGERDKVLVILDINCEGEEVEDFYFRTTAYCEVWADTDIDESDYKGKVLPFVAKELQERANRIAIEMNIPPFDFLTDEDVLQEIDI